VQHCGIVWKRRFIPKSPEEQLAGKASNSSNREFTSVSDCVRSRNGA
jgi:hypothetical protein